MMVLFVSECERRALKITRQILCRYTMQIGRRTWIGRLSREGLLSVQEALRAKATRQMAVACHRVMGRQRYELLWIVGSRRCFDHDGAFAFSASTRPVPREPYQAAPLERGIRYLAELAGLFHDLGKDNAFFQDKLKRNQRISDPLRHEYLSCLLLRQLAALVEKSVQQADLGFQKSDLTTDGSWIKGFADPAMLDQALSQLSKDGQWHINKKLIGQNRVLFDEETKQPLLKALTWLVISHHKLPTAGSSDNPLMPSTVKHYKSDAESDDLNKCLKLPDHTQRIWMSGRQWHGRVVEISRRLLRWWNEQGALLQRDPDAWWLTVTVYARSGLMLADHQVSAADTEDCQPQEKTNSSGIFANTNKVGKLAAPLERHLYQVGRESSQFAQQLFRLHLDLPVVPGHGVPQALRPQENLPESFRWQHAACEKIKAQQRNGIGQCGFFGLVMAGTGSGKTRGCASMIAALGEQLRYTVALGLRSLTRQTGDAYRKQLDLNDERYLAVLIGASLEKRIGEVSEEHGSESAAFLTDWQTTVTGELDVDQPLPERIAKLLGKQASHRLLMAAPILVCTVDHIVTAADPRRSYHLLPLLRLLSADLVLDEVDNYSEQDLIVLGKLVFLAGFAGRRVILSSATLPPPLAESFFEAYQRGYNHYLARTGQQHPLFVAWVSDLPGRQRVRRWNMDAPTKDFARSHQGFCASLVEGLDSRPVSRRVAFLNLPQSPVASDWWPVLAQGCLQAHQRHALTDPVSGKRLSIGLVRTAHVGPCWQFAHYLATRPIAENCHHYVAAYHSRLLPIMRLRLEQMLDRLLVRKDEQQFWQDHLIRRLLEVSDSADVILVVVATPVEEVGRDHDFDWGILEPSSARSGVQAGGRIRRHRPPGADSGNVWILSGNFNALKGHCIAYAHPGPESKHYPLPSHAAEDLLPARDWQQRLDGRHCLLPSTAADSAPLTTIEQQKLRDYLLEGSPERAWPDKGISKDITTLRAYISDRQQWLSSLHAECSRFREQKYLERLYWLDPIGGRWCGLEENTMQCVPVEGQITTVDKLPPQRLLLYQELAGEGWETHYATLAARYYTEGEQASGHAARQLLGIKVPDSSRALRFNQWLGMYNATDDIGEVSDRG